MIKIDIEATLAEIRKAMEVGAAIPGQAPDELACNRDGMDAAIEFARWSFTQRLILEPNDLATATGMLLGQMLIGSLGAFEKEDEIEVLNEVFGLLAMQINRHLSGDVIDGDKVVTPVHRDVGDA